MHSPTAYETREQAEKEIPLIRAKLGLTERDRTTVERSIIKGYGFLVQINQAGNITYYRKERS